MKKLKLRLGDLDVTSFAAEKETGAVHANEAVSSPATQCLCTEREGCYPSLYCTGLPGGCAVTYQEGCMTDNYSYC
jgi:hypothetical protein